MLGHFTPAPALMVSARAACSGCGLLHRTAQPSFQSPCRLARYACSRDAHRCQLQQLSKHLRCHHPHALAWPWAPVHASMSCACPPCLPERAVDAACMAACTGRHAPLCLAEATTAAVTLKHDCQSTLRAFQTLESSAAMLATVPNSTAASRCLVQAAAAQPTLWRASPRSELGAAERSPTPTPANPRSTCGTVPHIAVSAASALRHAHAASQRCAILTTRFGHMGTGHTCPLLV
jgi:hypothetical protein